MEYKELLEKLNIVEKDGGESYVGKVKDIIQLYLYFIKDNIDIDGKDNLENLVNSIEITNDFIKELIELDENMVIESYYNPMGAFTYKKYNEEEEENGKN
jgi:hypothetical protein